MWNRDGRWRDVEDVLRAAACDRDADEIIIQCLEHIVAPKSITQAVKGIVTAGPWKSTVYSGAKLNKMIKGHLKKNVTELDTTKFKY